MSKVYAMIADGTEEVECLMVVDLLRRAGIQTVLVSVCGREIIGSHKIAIRGYLRRAVRRTRRKGIFARSKSHVLSEL